MRRRRSLAHLRERWTAPDYEGYGYDPNGNRTSLRLRSSETIAFAYDNLNRESVKDMPGGTATDVYSAYDLAGRRLSARFVSASGQGIVYTYDTAGRLASETNTIGTSRALNFQYDLASNRTRVTHPDGNYFATTYDAMNRADLVQENGATTLADYGYDALARRASIARSNGTATTYSYDNASRLTGLAQDLPSTANDQTLGFAYTAASQISQRTASNDNFNWTGSNASRAYTRNGLNQYTNVAGSAFNYDARGNLISDGARNFQYDLENRLIQVSGAASGTLSYDPLGRLRQYTASSATTDFLYDGDRLSAEYNASGTLLRRYVHGPGVDEPLAWYEGSGTSDRRYLITDHQGSVIAENGAATTRYSYGPYGEPNTWTGSRFRYTGQAALPEVSLYHYKARVYDPVLGRFLQTDPVGYEADYNLYAYVRNDPLNRVDPTGMRDKPCGEDCQARVWYSRLQQEANGLAPSTRPQMTSGDNTDWQDSTAGGTSQVLTGMSTARDVQSTATTVGMAAAGANSEHIAGVDRGMRIAGGTLAVAGEATRVVAEVQNGEQPEGAIAAAGGRLVVTATAAEAGALYGAATGQPWGPPVGALAAAIAVQAPGGAEAFGEVMREAVNGTDPTCSRSLGGCGP